MFQCSANSAEFKDHALTGCLTILALLKIESDWIFVYQHEILDTVYVAFNTWFMCVIIILLVTNLAL